MRTLPAQQGVSLLVVVVVVLLCALLVLASTQAARLSEMLAGNDSEASRAFEAAEALLHDAELDVLGLGPQGQACQPDPAWVGCRHPATTTTVPRSLADFGLLAQQLAQRNPPCADGLCLDLGPASGAMSRRWALSWPREVAFRMAVTAALLWRRARATRCCSPVPIEGPGTGSRCCPTTRGPPPPGGIWRSGRPRRPTPSSSASPPWCRGGGQVPAPCCSPCWCGKCWAAPEAAEGE